MDVSSAPSYSAIDLAMKVAREEAALKEDLIKKSLECDDAKLSIRTQSEQEQSLKKLVNDKIDTIENQLEKWASLVEKIRYAKESFGIQEKTAIQLQDMTKQSAKELISEAQARKLTVQTQWELANELRTLTEKARILSENKKHILETIINLESEEKQVLLELEEAESLRQHAESSNHLVAVTIEAQEADLAACMKRLERQRHQRDEVIQEVQGLETTLQSLEATLAKEAEETSREKQAKTQQIETIKEKVEILQSQNRELSAAVEKISTRITSTEREISELDTLEVSLQESLLRKSADSIQVQEELSALREECALLRDSVPKEMEKKEQQLKKLREELARSEEEEKLVYADFDANQKILHELQEIVLPDLQAQLLNAKASCRRHLMKNVVTITSEIIDSVLASAQSEIVKALSHHKQLLPSAWEEILTQHHAQKWTTIALDVDELMEMDTAEDTNGNKTQMVASHESSDEKSLTTPPLSPTDDSDDASWTGTSKTYRPQTLGKARDPQFNHTKETKENVELEGKVEVEGEDIVESDNVEGKGSEEGNRSRALQSIGFVDFTVLHGTEWSVFVYQLLQELLLSSVVADNAEALTKAVHESERLCGVPPCEAVEEIVQLFKEHNEHSIHPTFIANVKQVKSFEFQKEVDGIFSNYQTTLSAQLPALSSPYYESSFCQEASELIQRDFASLETKQQALEKELLALEQKEKLLSEQMSGLDENMAQKIRRKERELEEKLRALYDQTDAEEVEAKKVLLALRKRLEEAGYTPEEIQQGQSEVFRTSVGVPSSVPLQESETNTSDRRKTLDKRTDKRTDNDRDCKRRGEVRGAVRTSHGEKETPFDFDGVLSTTPVRINPTRSRRSRK